jgi:hypothetical protein
MSKCIFEIDHYDQQDDESRGHIIDYQFLTSEKKGRSSRLSWLIDINLFDNLIIIPSLKI